MQGQAIIQCSPATLSDTQCPFGNIFWRRLGYFGLDLGLWQLVPRSRVSPGLQGRFRLVQLEKHADEAPEQALVVTWKRSKKQSPRMPVEMLAADALAPPESPLRKAKNREK